MDKINVLISHSRDLDGAVSMVLMKLMVSEDCGMSDSIITKWVEDPKKLVATLHEVKNELMVPGMGDDQYSETQLNLYIADLSITMSTVLGFCEAIESFRMMFGGVSVHYYDHHDTSVRAAHQLSKMSGFSIKLKEDECAASILARQLQFNSMRFINTDIGKLVSLVKDNDLWINAMPDTAKLKQAFYVMGADEFEKLITRAIREGTLYTVMESILSIGSSMLNKFNSDLLEIQKTYPHFTMMDEDGRMHKIGWWISDTYTSEIGEAMYTDGCSVAIIVSPRLKKIGLRSNKYRVDLFATEYVGGGGHKPAAGCGYPPGLETHDVIATLGMGRFPFNGRRFEEFFDDSEFSEDLPLTQIDVDRTERFIGSDFLRLVKLALNL